MFGSIFKMKVQPGKKDEVKSAMKDDPRKIKGAIAFYLFDTGGDELWGTAVFEDEKSYRANASDPEQDKWYRRLRALLVADPEWHDGTIEAQPVR